MKLFINDTNGMGQMYQIKLANEYTEIGVQTNCQLS